MNGNGNGGNKVRVQTFFTYLVPPITLAAAGSGSSTLRIESATDFVWFKGAYQAEIVPAAVLTDSTRIIPLVDVQMQVSGSDRNLASAPTPVPNWFGTGEIPFVLPAPMILLANSEITFNFTSRDTRILRMALSLIGLKDFGELTRPAPQ